MTNGWGDLFTSHHLAILGCMGFAPHWVRHFASMDCKNINLPTLESVFPKCKLTKGNAPMQFLSTLTGNINAKNDNGVTVSFRCAENHLCKAATIIRNNGSCNNCHDTCLDLGVQFAFKDDMVIAMHENGSNNVLHGGIINKFPHGNELLPLNEIGLRMGIATEMSSKDILQDMR